MTAAAATAVRSGAGRSEAFPVSSAASVVCLSLLCVLLVFGVLAFGAVENWSTSILEIGSALLLTLWMLTQVQSAAVQVKWSPLYLPMFTFGLLIAFQITFNLTAYRYATLLAGLQYLAFCALLFVAMQITGDERSAKIVLSGLGLFGVALAGFAICQDLSSNGKLYWLRMPSQGGSIFGPYVNHNHYAGLMEMLAPLLLVLSLGRLLRGAARALAGFATVLMAASIVLSRSRAGTISLLAELVFFWWIASRTRRRIRMRYGMLLMVSSVLIFLAWIGSEAMWQHLGDLQDATRLAILRDSLRMVRLKPVSGWGLGTFPTVYPAYRSFYTDLFVNAAHNDYLQALVETGAVGLGCVVWFIVALYRRGHRMADWTQHWSGALRVATLTGCTGLLVHSAFDFNLQVPANAALFFVFSAIACNETRRSSSQMVCDGHVIRMREHGTIELRRRRR
jgi:O-antigen ligase